MNEKLQFIPLTYLWSHGVDEKGQYGLEPADPTATPMFFHATPFGVATPGLGTADLEVLMRGGWGGGCLMWQSRAGQGRTGQHPNQSFSPASTNASFHLSFHIPLTFFRLLEAVEQSRP